MRTSCIFYLLILLIIFSCEKSDEEFQLSIVGVWFQGQDEIAESGMSYRNEMKLNKDGTYERSLQIVETNDVQNVVGYKGLFIGEYQIIDKKLKLMNIKHYGLDNKSEYLDREDLVFQFSTTESPEIELGLDKSGDVLTLFYTSSDNASCVPSETFYRSK